MSTTWKLMTPPSPYDGATSPASLGRNNDHTAASAWSRSARMSSMCSMPIDSRT